MKKAPVLTKVKGALKRQGEMHEAIEAMGLSGEEYWDELWNVVKNRPDAARCYFESIDITAFDPH